MRLLLFCTVAALAATYTPEIHPSCNPCTFPNNIDALGSGFKPHSKVTILVHHLNTPDTGNGPIHVGADGKLDLSWERVLYNVANAQGGGDFQFEAVDLQGHTLAVSEVFHVSDCGGQCF